MVKVVMLHGGGGVERSKGIAFPERKNKRITIQLIWWSQKWFFFPLYLKGIVGSSVVQVMAEAANE